MDRQLHDRKEARTGNSGFASCGVQCLNSSSVFQFNYSAGLTVLCPEIPHERKAAKRYRLQLSKLFPTVKKSNLKSKKNFNKHLKLIKLGLSHQDDNPKA